VRQISIATAAHCRSLIPTLLAETRRISFFSDVANLPLRPPALMAKAAASLDVLSGGRFELGLGARGLPYVIAGFGAPRRTPGESVEALDEAIDVIRPLWSEERSVSFDGRYCVRRSAARAPDRDLGRGVQAQILRLVGRKADGWLLSGCSRVTSCGPVTSRSRPSRRAVTRARSGDHQRAVASVLFRVETGAQRMDFALWFQTDLLRQFCIECQRGRDVDR
jgi:alkanesulfonate monooxygenase SsuD/methylene tetrahydromethanopterin reductase-like flavin-dependent oxidoreductase (luciferase family)